MPRNLSIAFGNHRNLLTHALADFSTRGNGFVVGELRAHDLSARGYQLLTQSPQCGVDIFAKQLRSQFIFFQGHPEYEALSLEREYLRDISRFLAGGRDLYPAVPAGYFDTETEAKLASFERRAHVERRPSLSSELPERTLRQDATTGTAATAIFRNWLDYLSSGAHAQRAAGASAGLPAAS